MYDHHALLELVMIGTAVLAGTVLAERLRVGDAVLLRVQARLDAEEVRLTAPSTAD